MPEFYGTYKPSYFKKIMCWLLDEKLYPIDWEEVPFDAEAFDSSDLVASRRSFYFPNECVSQPDMLTKNQVYNRRILLAFVFYGLYKHLENKYYFYNRYYFIRNYYYKHWWGKIFIGSWMYYITCKLLLDRHSQTTYN